jgi:methylmalonyl-CoA mutase
LNEGTPQRELKKMLEKKLADVNNRKTTIIGTNAFANLSDHVTKTQQQFVFKDHDKEAKQVGSFQDALVFVRENKGVPTFKKKCLENQLQIEPIKQLRLVERFERLRTNAANYVQKTGQLPKVGVIVFGKLKDYKPRLDFVSGLLSAGGIKVEVVSYEDIDQLPNVNTLIFCGKDEDYDLINASLIRKLKAEKPVHLYITGEGHGKKIEEYGLDGYISANMNAYEFLVNLHHIMEVGI